MKYSFGIYSLIICPALPSFSTIRASTRGLNNSHRYSSNPAGSSASAHFICITGLSNCIFCFDMPQYYIIHFTLIFFVCTVNNYFLSDRAFLGRYTLLQLLDFSLHVAHPALTIRYCANGNCIVIHDAFGARYWCAIQSNVQHQQSVPEFNVRHGCRHSQGI